MTQNTKNLTDTKLYPTSNENIKLQIALAQKQLSTISCISIFSSLNLEIDYVRNTTVNELYTMLENLQIIMGNLDLQIQMNTRP